eukprot:NODE_5905_length_951_cov_70.368357_g5320_i0.p1 GENE.NODE_5905_length_951_cov_70.368357_g5320_i0~~NODE_5905_length_951_cov_70.368357_g5320_i0.p1  ORF type:complete len:279 (+),score=58.60 NODE_5905_length_951_cov_70.368357_g5320_i0:51-839(+)
MSHSEAAQLVKEAAAILKSSSTNRAGDLLKRAAELLEREHHEVQRAAQQIGALSAERQHLEDELAREKVLRQDAERRIGEFGQALAREREAASRLADDLSAERAARAQTEQACLAERARVEALESEKEREKSSKQNELLRASQEIQDLRFQLQQWKEKKEHYDRECESIGKPNTKRYEPTHYDERRIHEGREPRSYDYREADSDPRNFSQFDKLRNSPSQQNPDVQAALDQLSEALHKSQTGNRRALKDPKSPPSPVYNSYQ